MGHAEGVGGENGARRRTRGAAAARAMRRRRGIGYLTCQDLGGFNGGEDNFCTVRVVHEIISGADFGQARETLPGMFEVLHLFNPYRSTIGKLPEDIVSWLHNYPLR